MGPKKKELINFCKSVKTVSIPFSDLYSMYLKKNDKDSDTYLSRSFFENGLLSLNKKVALNMKDKCIEYFTNEGDFGYFKLCKEIGLVSKPFWVEAIKGLEPNKKVKLAEPDTFEEAPGEDLHDTFHKLLPIDWEKMDKSERISFAKKIKHEKFREYVLSLDVSVKNYLDKLTTYSRKPFNLYTTLLQFPADNYSEEAKNLLKCFVEMLNSLGRTSLQYMTVEVNEQKTIEIREMR